MKAIVSSISLFITLTSFGQSQDYILEQLYGAWGDTTQVNGGNGFIFQPDGSWMLIWDGNISGGNTETGKSYFSIDFTSFPITIDLVVENTVNREKRSMVGILEFVESNLIRVEFSRTNERPTEFSITPNSDQQILRKAEEN